MKRLVLIAAIALAVAGCSLERNDGEAFRVRLPAVNDTPAVAAKTAPTLEIMLPDAPAQLDTQRIALRRGDKALDYYAGMRWADFLPLLVQAALVRDLNGSGLVTASDDTSPGPWQYQLDTSLEFWSVRHPPEGPVANLKINWRLSKARQPVASGAAEGYRPLENETQQGIADGFAAAYHDAQTQLAQEIMAKMAPGGARINPRRPGK